MSSSSHGLSRQRKFWVIALFLAGAAVRLVDIQRVPGTNILQSWREGDIGCIARNYVRESMNILEPRIDWRGDGPGIAEMEFPFFPWLIAVGYKAFGYHEITGRVIAWIAGILTLWCCWRMARDLLPEFAAIAALAFLAFSPPLVRISSSLQAEGFMMLFYVLAVQGFLKWLREDTWANWAFGAVATSAAILAKLPAAHLGFLFALLILGKEGWQVVRRPRVWAFATVALLPGIAWYGLAHRYYVVYGNSLGLSNMHHLLTWDVLTSPAHWMRLFEIEFDLVWMPTGPIVAAVAIAAYRNHPATRIALAWLAAIGIYFVVTLRTNGSVWAAYYHVVVVPPAALLIGLGADACAAWLPPRPHVERIGWGLAGGGLLASLAARAVFPDISIGKLLLIVGSFVFAARLLPLIGNAGSGISRSAFPDGVVRSSVGVIGAVALSGTLVFEARNVYWEFRRSGLENLHACAESFAPRIPESSLIVVTGYHRIFEGGYIRPYNASYFFYWLDRKGWNIPIEDQNLPYLEGLIARGARYYVAEKDVLNEEPGWESTLREKFSVVEECEDAILFSLESR